jgi:tRNA C32,U32 (ribose-2'-O)-methylase TrmJ
MNQFKDVLAKGQEQSKKDVEQVANLMEQIKDLLKELQLCQNNNFVWVMNTMQSICDKQGIKLKDEMETNNG